MAARLLRKTGEAIKHSPSALRRALSGGNKGSYELSLVQAQDPFKVGLSFHITYAGYEEVKEPEGEKESQGVDGKLTNAIVVRQMNETRTRPRRRVMLIVNNTCITVVDPEGKRRAVRIPLYRVAFAGSHPINVNAFAFVERLRDSERLLCHVMLCQSEHMARTIVRVVSKAFQNAFLEWTAKQKRLGQPDPRSSHGFSARGEDSEETPAPASESSSTAVGSTEGDAVAVKEDAAEDVVVAETDEQSDDATEEEKDRRALHRSFYRRSIIVRNPEKLETGALDVTPDDFDLDEAAEFVAPLEPGERDGLSEPVGESS